VLQRRSAVSFDGRGSIDAARCFAMLSAVMPREGPPWDALWWDARIHLLLFVHRVNGLRPRDLPPGAPLLSARSDPRGQRARVSLEPCHDSLPLFALVRGDCRALAQRVSCDQAIAGEGFFSLGMIADFDASLQAFGAAFYRHLFWESGVVGQVLYLEAEAAGTRGTGIGCFLRRSGARCPRPHRARISEPVPLHHRLAGRRHTAEYRTRLCMGKGCVSMRPRLGEIVHKPT
jgi:hypothetical protein